MLKHFVLTRIGLGISSQEWFDESLDLFEAVTCSSLAGQTSQEFVWCVVADAGMPAAARERLTAILARRPNFHVVPTDVTRMTHMHLGGHDWIYEPCRRYILEHALVTDPFDYIITSVIDADDAWHRGFVAAVNEFFAPRVPALIAEEARRGPHLQHSAGAVLTFPYGLQWFATTNAIAPMRFPFHSTSVSVAVRFSSGVSALSCRHARWPSQGDLLRFDVFEREPDRPMWVYVRQPRSDVGWDARAEPAADDATLGELTRTFGIDLARVDAWRSGVAARAGGQPPGVHPHQPVGARYERFFRLTALNQQIAALEGRLQGAGAETRDAGPLAELLARQRAVRDQLLARHRESGA
jgi:hypothetical protein